jgi:glyoxylase-like metal-dependent hydrolase (beta-lactamase superfamily II)
MKLSRRLIAVAVAAVVASGGTTFARTAEVPGLNAHIQVAERVDPVVHLLRQPEPTYAGVVGNVTVILQSDGVVLVDSGGAHGGGVRVVQFVKSITDLPVKAVILTHWHNDHPLGISAIRAAWPDADVVSTTQTLEAMQGGSLGVVPTSPSAEYEATRERLLREAAAQYETRSADASLSEREREQWRIAAQAAERRVPDIPGTYMILPDLTFTDSYRIDDPVAPLEVIHPGSGNTDGDAIVWLPRQRVLVAGDIVVDPIPYMFNVRPTAMREVLNTLDRYDYRVLIPGHGAPQYDHAYLRRVMALMDDVLRQMTPAAAAGSLEDAVKTMDFSAQRSAFAGTDEWTGYWFDAYALSPLLRSAYREVRGEPPR